MSHLSQWEPTNTRQNGTPRHDTFGFALLFLPAFSEFRRCQSVYMFVVSHKNISIFVNPFGSDVLAWSRTCGVLRLQRWARNMKQLLVDNNNNKSDEDERGLALSR
jgi:hypothetical protein